jgi:hypothetical protein
VEKRTLSSPEDYYGDDDDDDDINNNSIHIFNYCLLSANLIVQRDLTKLTRVRGKEQQTFYERNAK